MKETPLPPENRIFTDYMMHCRTRLSDSLTFDSAPGAKLGMADEMVEEPMTTTCSGRVISKAL
jgi:hypothetical protein